MKNKELISELMKHSLDAEVIIDAEADGVSIVGSIIEVFPPSKYDDEPSVVIAGRE